jgi:L,D-transpeptidase catalytic domain
MSGLARRFTSSCGVQIFSPRHPLAVTVALALCVFALLAQGCSPGSSAQSGSITIEPLGVGGKPATPPSAPTYLTPDPGAPLRPTAGRWIEVDVTNFVVRLMDGTNIVQEITPVAVGAQVDTGAYASTQTGLFHVYNKIEDLSYDPPYKTYISDWVGFDVDRANGFHSFLKDKSGNVVDGSTGRVSNGCIRTGAEAAIYAFAEIGMPVWVHT